MLGSARDVIRCLTMFTDWWQPASSSVLQVGAARRGNETGDGLHPGIVETLDERTELRVRVSNLDDKARRVLFLWYVAQLPVGDIARAVGMSQRQCHRIRAKAVGRIVELGRDAEAA